MKTATKAEVTAIIDATEVTATVAPTKAKKARAPKTVEQALTTEIGSAAPSTKPAKAAKKADGFVPGTSTFKCVDCGKLTRTTNETSSDNLCPCCYEIAGLENAASDSEGTEAHAEAVAALEAALAARNAAPAPLLKPAANVAPAASQADLYAMPAGVATRPGTRKAAVYDAMCAISPATRTDLIAAAEMAEQEWRAGTKRLEAPKPGAKWFRRFAPVAVQGEA